MSISKSSVKYILMFLGLLIFLCGYFFVFMDYSDKTDALDKEIKELSARLEQLNGYNAKLEQYKTTIDEDRQQANAALGRFYSNETAEDFIMFAVAMEDEIGPNVKTVSFTKALPVYDIMAVKDLDDYKIPAEYMTLTSYKISSTMDTEMAYDEMKEALDFIYTQKDVTKLDSLNINYDSSTGLILGSFTIDKYFITGRDIQEHQAVVPYTDIGKDVLIGG